MGSVMCSPLLRHGVRNTIRETVGKVRGAISPPYTLVSRVGLDAVGWEENRGGVM